ncbi:MAG TPA: TolC family protein [Flavobacterium sp.]|nr:TolC family protein [Flavobacterium sp.]
MKRSILITLLFFAVAANAQDTPKESYSFSLQQAIDHALQHNYTAINSGRDIEIAQQKKWETTAAGLPQINGSIDYQNNIKRQVILADFDNDGVSEPIYLGDKQSVNAKATLSQLLFDGSYIVALQASKTYLQYYKNYKQKTDNDVREMVVNAYGNVLLAEESIAILEKNKSILDKTLSDTRETFKNGLIEEENVEQLEITQASVNSNLNNARRLKDIASQMLKLTLGIDINADLQLTDKLDALTQSNLDLALAQPEFDIKNNIDYKIGQNFQDQRRLELMQQKSKALPTLSAFVNYGTFGSGHDFDFLTSKQKYYDFSLLGVSLNVPIFSSFARSARTQQAKIAYEQAKTQLTETEQRLKLQYQQAKSEYEFSVEEYATQKNSLALAEHIEGKQQIKFTEGLSTSFDFSDAQRQLYTAQQDYLQSMVDVVNKRAALEKITNGK